MAFCGQKKDKCWVWIAYDRDAGKVCGFELGKRDAKTARKLTNQLELFDIDLFCTDEYPTYKKVLPEEKHVATKAETCAVEGFNSRVRHYLARFHRKTFCYSKALHMVHASLTVFLTPNWYQYLS